MTLSSDNEEATTTTPEAEAGIFEMIDLTVDSSGSKSSDVSIVSNGENLPDDESIFILYLIVISFLLVNSRKNTPQVVIVGFGK